LFGGGARGSTAGEAKEEAEKGDEKRIRVQVMLDVNAFGKEAERLGVDVLNTRAFLSLREMAHKDDPPS
jgi:hypothetical protein